MPTPTALTTLPLDIFSPLTPVAGSRAPRDLSPIFGAHGEDGSLGVLLAMIDHLPVGVCFVDRKMNILAFNLSARRLLDLPPGLFEHGFPAFEEIVRFNANRGEYGQGDPSELVEGIMALARGMSPHHFERRRPNGRVLDIRGEPLPGGGFVTIWTDVTAKSVAEERLGERNAELEFINQELSATQRQLIQSEKMASIGQLAAGVAHEINNPIGFVGSNLGTFCGYATDLLALAAAAQEAVKEMANGPARAALCAAIEQADPAWLAQDIPPLLAESRDGIERVKKIVQDLKDFSRPESSDAQWQLSDLVQGVRSTASIAKNEIKYCADIVDELPDCLEVECLPSSLNQVFLNCLVNAAHAIESKGQGRGSIVLRGGSGDGMAWVEFEDNGCGMEMGIAKKIFDPFFTTKPVGKGTGLGLSIAHGIVVEKHRGAITVDSAPGKGTIFRVSIPLSQRGQAVAPSP